MGFSGDRLTSVEQDKRVRSPRRVKQASRSRGQWGGGVSASTQVESRATRLALARPTVIPGPGPNQVPTRGGGRVGVQTGQCIGARGSQSKSKQGQSLRGRGQGELGHGRAREERPGGSRRGVGSQGLASRGFASVRGELGASSGKGRRVKGEATASVAGLGSGSGPLGPARSSSNT